MPSSLFTRPLDLWRPSAVSDGRGGRTETLTQVGDTALLGKVDQPSPVEVYAAAQNGITLTHAVYFDGVTDVRRGDELRGDGEVFRVESVVSPSTPVYTKAMCERTQSEGVA